MSAATTAWTAFHIMTQERYRREREERHRREQEEARKRLEAQQKNKPSYR